MPEVAITRKMQYVFGMIADSTITCPKCGHKATERMPTDACQFFYDCKGCGGRLKPLPGDCCVFCSYGSVPCPPIQRESPRVIRSRRWYEIENLRVVDRSE